ncbi:MAG: hypothetical protein LBR07_08790 [Puniceicoccales bacterium]|nr:hypothetical protein [Puniceicoccales bacterium]
MQSTPATCVAALCGLALLVLPADAQSARSGSSRPAAGAAAGGAAAEGEGKLPFEIVSVQQQPSNVAGFGTGTQRIAVAFRTSASRGADEGLSSNPAWIDKPKVTLTLAYRPDKRRAVRVPASRTGAAGATAAAGGAAKTGAGATAGAAAAANSEFLFFRASATLLAVERPSSGFVFFYLPGEIVRRDGLGREPYAYIVEAEASGKTARVFRSKNLLKEDEFTGFKTMADTGALATSGLLRNSAQAGFDIAGGRNSPTVLRDDQN